MAETTRQLLERSIAYWDSNPDAEVLGEGTKDRTRWQLGLLNQYGVNNYQELPPDIRQQFDGTKKSRHEGINQALGLATLAASGQIIGTGMAGAAAANTGGATAAGAQGVTVGSYGGAAAAGAPTVAGTATGAGQFLTAAGTALPAAAAPAYASGTTAGGTVAPAVQGATTGGTGAGTAATGTALSRILDGSSQGSGDYLSVAGQVLPAALSAYGSYQQSQDMQDLAKRYEGYGAPYRQTLADISQDPNKFYESPTATKATDAILRRLSVAGNPAGNPYSQALGVDALYKEYGAERDRLAGFGGLTQYNSAAPGAAAGAINAQGSIYSDLGYGLGNVLSPKPTLAQQLAQYKAAGGTY